MRGFITDPKYPAGLRLADDLPEPGPKPDEIVLDVRAFAINHDEVNLIARRPIGQRPEREAQARELGAHRVVTSLDDQSLGPFHLVLDATGGAVVAQAVRLMAPEGNVVLYGNVGGPAQIALKDFYRQGWNGRIVGSISPVPEETKGEDLGILAGLVADGRLVPRIGLVLDWERTAEAFEALTIRTLSGKAVLTRTVARSE